MLSEAQVFADAVKTNRRLTSVNTKLFLKMDEKAYWEGATTLLETRAVRKYQSGSTGFRVAKGVYVGGTKGHSYSNEEWTKIADGTLTITNKRLVFNGDKSDRNVPLDKIINIDNHLDAISVSSENRQKTMVFMLNNPAITSMVLSICIQADNPDDLSGVDLNIEIQKQS